MNAGKNLKVVAASPARILFIYLLKSRRNYEKG
jgi:hypothetical protein